MLPFRVSASPPSFDVATTRSHTAFYTRWRLLCTSRHASGVHRCAPRSSQSPDPVSPLPRAGRRVPWPPAALQLLLPGGPSARPDPRRSARTAAAAAAVHANPQVGAAGASAVATVTRGSAPRTSPPRRAVTPRAARRFIHPIDVVKTRLQVSGGAIGDVIGSAMKNEGPLAFYKGINAAWLREASYTSLRLGLYEPIKGIVGAKDKDAHFLKKFAAGCLAGAIGSLVGNPFDVLKTRMMASTEGTSFGAEAKSLMDSQGVAGFYRGIDANISRAMVLNGTKMACYDERAAARAAGPRVARKPARAAGASRPSSRPARSAGPRTSSSRPSPPSARASS